MVGTVPGCYVMSGLGSLMVVTALPSNTSNSSRLSSSSSGMWRRPDKIRADQAFVAQSAVAMETGA